MCPVRYVCDICDRKIVGRVYFFEFDDDGDGLNFLAGKSFEEINALLIETLHQAALLPEDSTFPAGLNRDTLSA
jgi:hypothetical protein